ncbi:MAG: hypothetical protein V4510_07575 [bacterium]
MRDVLRSPILPFAALSIALLVWHEPWRDEAETWLIARDSLGVGGFFHAMSYEGTPALWHLMLVPLAKAGLPFLAERVLHAGIAVASVCVLWFFSPFGRLEKWLIAFGYYTAYEYDAIARSYALFAFLLFVLLAVDYTRRERPLRYAIVLALLAQTNVHGLMVAGVFAAAFGLELLQGRVWTRRATMGAAVAAGGFLLAVMQLIPAHDLSPWLSAWHPSIYTPARSTLATFLPIPSLGQVFWDHSIFDPLPTAVKVVFAGLLLAASCWPMRHNVRVLSIYVAAAGALTMFFAVRYGGAAHHAGLVFLVFLACTWLARTRPADTVPLSQRLRARWPTMPRAPKAVLSGLSWFLPVVLVVQVVGAAIAIERDATGEFSAAGDVAAYLEAHRILDGRTLVVVFQTQSGMPVLAQLHDPNVRFWFPDTGSLETFPHWSATWDAGRSMTLDDVLASSDRAAPGYERVFLLQNEQVPASSANATARLMPVASFGDHLVGNKEESYTLYLVRPASA